MRFCYACGAEYAEREQPGFSATCPRCPAYLHCCRNCKFHSPGMHNDCRETQAELVADKEARNVCEFFLFADRPARAGAGAPDGGDRAAAARAKLEALFRKDPPPPSKGGGR